MKAEEITKGSTLLAILNEKNFPFGMHKDLIDDLHRMINIVLNIPIVSITKYPLPRPLEAWNEAQKLDVADYIDWHLEQEKRGNER